MVGQPTPQVVWLHNDKPIEEGKGKTIMQDSEGICQLAISEVFPEDCGVYTCTATNTAGKAVCATTLVVEGNISSIFFKLFFSKTKLFFGF